MRLPIDFFVFLFIGMSLIFLSPLRAQTLPKIIEKEEIIKENYLPDFSYAGYHYGEDDIPDVNEIIISAADYGVKADDGLDDSKALLKAISETKEMSGSIVLQLPPGRLILSEVLFIERSNFVLRGAGVGKGGTEIYCPRPMMYMEDPQSLKELREYLVKHKKRQIEKENNIDLPFSQYAWSGGIIWTQVPGERVKSYMMEYEKPSTTLAKVEGGQRGEHILKVSDVGAIKKGDVLQLELFNKEGKDGVIIEDLYKGADVKVGSHHWNFPDLPIVRQQVEVISVSPDEIKIKTPLTISVKKAHQARLIKWKHLEEVGIENFKISFPQYPWVAHHVEPGFNGIYLTRLFNSWVKNVVIVNADSGILTEEIANVTIENILTKGSNTAHYTVAMGGVHNVLVKNLNVYNEAVHPLSFNTFSTKSVYKDCEVFVKPVLDQHSGANHQNLFDNIRVHVNPGNDGIYPLFRGGGAGYWKPSHGAYSTFWNIEVHFLGGLNIKSPFLLNGMNDGPHARLIGVHGNHDIELNYGPGAFVEKTNSNLENIPSLYEYQLNARLKK
ncbi:glycoside hydrolase family 55 protein [Christiangramia crocea]|uniref:Glycoside hydrolase family 55 protein n=1 Tax=Christiangramia crocea TaxID=2904124 RepID=A0A9X1UUI9_9FLAO|nr:glycoside hydrolase family 55 protein [Gramella crocea]MCG9970539.1 glycoside hydrolase family 55 protein [Gramella crocea]